MKEKTNRLYQFNGFQLDVDGGTLKKGPEIVQITPKAFETLVVLLKNRGKVVDKEIFFNEVWTDIYVEEGTLAQNISTLRKTLGTLENGKQFIETVPRRGYKVVADVNEFVTNEETFVIEKIIHTEIKADFRIHNSDEPENQNNSAAVSNSGSKNKSPGFLLLVSKNARKMALGLTVIVLISLAAFSYFKTRENSTAPPINSIAVLPFQTIGEQDRDKRLSFGLTDAVITRLSKLQKMPVRPTSAVFRFTEQPAVNAITAGRELNVDAVLGGTIQYDGDRVRVTVQLTGVADGKPLWAETFDEKSADIFALQDSISSKLAHSLALKLTPEQEKQLNQRMTNNVEAFEAYQLGFYLWNTRTQENLEKAKRYFENAVKLDPEFARAYAMLADTEHLITYYNSSNSTELYEQVRTHAMKALALDDSIAEAYLALAAVQIQAGNLDLTERYLEAAVERAPYNSTVRIRYSWFLLRLGKNDLSLNEMKLAQEYDPLSPVTNGALCNMQIYRENFPEAVKLCRRAVEISPNTADNRLSLAFAYFFNGNPDEAIAQAKLDLERGEDKNSALAALGYFYVRSGNIKAAETIVAQLKPEAEKDQHINRELAVLIYELGRKDEAYKYFKKAYESKSILTLTFNNDPLWKAIREDPQFAKLMEES